MWHVEQLDGTLNGTVYLVKSDQDQGYLSNNSPGGGALHFSFKDEAMDVCRLLNSAVVR